MYFHIAYVLSWMTVLVSLSTTSTVVTACDLECSSTDIIKDFVGNDVSIGCPMAVGESLDSIMWFIKKPNQNECQMESLVNSSSQSLILPNISKTDEGGYYCTPVLDSRELDRRLAQCLYVSGNAILQCKEDNDCNKALSTTKQQNATFNASVEFIGGGGFITQPIELTFYKEQSSIYDYQCDGTESGCVDSDVINVDFRRRDNNIIDISLSLMNLTMSMSGLYVVRLEAYDFKNINQRTRLNQFILRFDLSVTAPNTETTISIEEITTTVEMATTEQEVIPPTTPPLDSTTTSAIDITTTQTSEVVVDGVDKNIVLTGVLSALAILFCTVIASGIVIVTVTRLKAYYSCMCMHSSSGSSSTDDSSTKYNIDIVTPSDKDPSPPPTCCTVIDMEGPKCINEFLNSRRSFHDNESELADDNFSRLCNNEDLLSIASLHNDTVHLPPQRDSGPSDV